jgi:hypothetical protein
MSAALVRPSTPYINTAPAIIAHPLALQFNWVSIFDRHACLSSLPQKASRLSRKCSWLLT